MPPRSALALLLLSASVALGEESVRRTVEDAGVHIPVLTKAPELTGFVEATYPPEAEAQGLTAQRGDARSPSGPTGACRTCT